MFLRRAILLLDGLEKCEMAHQALYYVCQVWGVEESPIRFALQHEMEEFISHASIQKDASIQMFKSDKFPNREIMNKSVQNRKAEKGDETKETTAFQTWDCLTFFKVGQCLKYIQNVKNNRGNCKILTKW